MELMKELFIDFLRSENFEEELKRIFETIVEKECYKALKKIKEIIQNDDLEDSECFSKIEEMVCLFESMGINAGCRHDF